MRGQSVKIALSLLVIGGAATYLLADTLVAGSDTLTYFHPADAVIVDPQAFVGKRIRMGGFVEKDSILKREGTLEYRFRVKPIEGMMKHPAARGQTIAVEYTGIVPDTFKDDAEVIVGGQMQSDGHFVAQELVAKCPSKYEAQEKNEGTY